MWKASIFLAAFSAISHGSSYAKTNTFVAHTQLDDYSRLDEQIGCEVQTNLDCGGFMKGPMGIINYKLYENMSSNEACVWTILVPSKQTLQVKIIDSGHPIEMCGNCEMIEVISIGDWGAEFKATKHIDYYDRTAHTVTGSSQYSYAWSLFQITLTTMNRENRGFILQFEGVGDPVDESTNNIAEYKIYEQLGAPTGVIMHKQQDNNKFEVASFTVHPEEGKEIELTLSNVYSNYDPSRYACSTFMGAVSIYEVGHSGTFETDFQLRLRECRSNRNVTIVSPLPLVAIFGTHALGQFQLDWRMI